MSASERTQCAWWKTNTMVLPCTGFLASGWMRPTQLKEHPAVYLRIHFMIWKELDSTKIWICSSTNPLSWSTLCDGLSHCQRNSAPCKRLRCWWLQSERRWQQCLCPMTLSTTARPALLVIFEAAVKETKAGSSLAFSSDSDRCWVSLIMCPWATSKISVWAPFGNIKGRYKLFRMSTTFLSW